MDASKQILKPSQVFFHKIYDFNEHIVKIPQLLTLPNFNKKYQFCKSISFDKFCQFKKWKTLKDEYDLDKDIYFQ